MSSDSPPEESVSSSALYFGILSEWDLAIIVTLGVIAIAYLFFRRKGTSESTSLSNGTVSANFKVIAAPSRTNDPSFINKMKNMGRNVVIFYGSQTGTAEDFANRLSKDCVSYGMKGLVADPEDCDMDELKNLTDIKNSLAIFCLATYGEGDPTDNAQEFYDWLQNGEFTLDGMNYVVFGLGNKTYEHYNAMGKYVDRRLVELGGERVFELGMGDDDANIEEDFLTWKDPMWLAVCEKFGISAEALDIRIRQYKVETPTDLPVEKIYSGELGRLGSFVNQKPPYDAKNPYLAPIKVNRELHKGGERSCMHIELDITGSRIKYECGDHVAIYPVNDLDIVNAIGNRLNVNLEEVFTLINLDEDSNKKHPFPCPCTYRTALAHYLDITHPPKTNVLRELAEYTSDSKEQEFLKLIASSTPEGKLKYKEWIIDDRRHILAVLEDLPSLQPPLDHICELLPRLQPRFYSISSSPKMHFTTIHVTAVVVDYTTRVGRHMKGVATSWLKAKVPQGEDYPRVPIYVRRSQFRLPYKVTTPVVMIGPGTGIAPFRGFVQDRLVAKRSGKPVGPMVLYYGCRHRVEDYIYEEELDEAKQEGSLTDLHLAFSRDQEYKVYVQHVLRTEPCRKQLWELLEQGGHFYICGDAKNMSRDVLAALEEVLISEGNMTKAEAQEYIRKMHNKGRYAADVWS